MQKRKDYKKFIGFWTIEGKNTHNERIAMFIMMCGFLLLTYFGIGGIEGYINIYNYYFEPSNFVDNINGFNLFCSVVSSIIAFVYLGVLFGFDVK